MKGEPVGHHYHALRPTITGAMFPCPHCAAPPGARCMEPLSPNSSQGSWREQHKRQHDERRELAHLAGRMFGVMWRRCRAEEQLNEMKGGAC